MHIIQNLSVCKTTFYDLFVHFSVTFTCGVIMVENIVNFLVSSSLINVALLNKTLWPDSNAYTFTEALFSSGV